MTATLRQISVQRQIDNLHRELANLIMHSTNPDAWAEAQTIEAAISELKAAATRLQAH